MIIASNPTSHGSHIGRLLFDTQSRCEVIYYADCTTVTDLGDVTNKTACTVADALRHDVTNET